MDEKLQKLRDKWEAAGGKIEVHFDFEISPTRSEAQQRLENLNLEEYGKTRNHIEGAVSKLSPFLRMGLYTTNSVIKDLRSNDLSKSDDVINSKFVQELFWREYFHSIARKFPNLLWEDVQEIKTGWKSSDYQENLPSEISQASTGTAVIDRIIRDLLRTGWIHNRCRLYLASYVVHFKRVKWQTGARWMLSHLIDGDVASNNFSWQWVTSTFSKKPYIFNLESAQKFLPKDWDLTPESNHTIDCSYSDLNERLFRLKGI